jgi:hypothetical protein
MELSCCNGAEISKAAPLILSFSPGEKGRLNSARSVPHRPLFHGERDRVRGGSLSAVCQPALNSQG